MEVMKRDGTLIAFDKEKIINYARKHLNPNIKLYQMSVDENAFRLKAEDITNIQCISDVELEKEFDESVKFPPKAITFPPLQFGPVTLVPALQPFLFILA